MNGQALQRHPRSTIFFAVFALCLLAGLILQLMLLPSIPSLHAGNGLLQGGDWVWFHDEAVRLAQRMLNQGWSVWAWRHNANAPIGMTAALYFITDIYSPWIVLPINAAMFAFSSLLLYEIYSLFTPVVLIRIAALLPFTCFPSAAIIYGQIHKDIFSITGFLMVVLSFSLLVRQKTINKFDLLIIILLLFGGIFFIWSVRPYLLMILFMAAATGLFFVCVFWWNGRQVFWWFSVVIALLILYFGATTNLSRGAPIQPIDFTGSEQSVASSSTVERSSNFLILSKAYRALRYIIVKIDTSRHSFGGAEGRNRDMASNIDIDIRIESISGLASYLPRAFQIALFSPFPNSWWNTSPNPGGNAMRKISAVEMTVSYILLCGLIFGFTTKWKDPSLWMVLYIALFFVVIHALSVPNVGALYRLRYGAWQLLNGIGVIGLFCLYQRISLCLRARPIAR